MMTAGAVIILFLLLGCFSPPSARLQRPILRGRWTRSPGKTYPTFPLRRSRSNHRWQQFSKNYQQTLKTPAGFCRRSCFPRRLGYLNSRISFSLALTA